MDSYDFPKPVGCRSLGKTICTCVQRTIKSCEEHDGRKTKSIKPEDEEENDVVFLQRSLTTTCTVNLQGATITSWRIENEEQLFVAKPSYYHPHLPIRGGVSLAFPFFRQWSFGPRYGFARKIRWRVLIPPQKLASGDVQAAFIVCDNAYTRSMWSNNFWLCLWVILKAFNLHLRFFVFNTNNTMPFECTPMFMTTFRVPNVTQCVLTGVKDCECSDDENVIVYDVEEKGGIIVQQSIQRLYHNTPDLTLNDLYSGHKISLVKDLPDMEIWNPWKGENSVTCFYTQVSEDVDFEPEDYLNMLRISCGHVRKPVTLKPNEYFIGHMVINVEKPREILLRNIERRRRTSRVLPQFPRDSILTTPQLPRFSTYMLHGARETATRSQLTNPSLTDIPYLIAEEIFSQVTKQGIPFMMAEEIISEMTKDDVGTPYHLAEEIVSQVTNT